MQIDEMIAVLTAAKEGKRIQYKRHEFNEWYDNNDSRWNFEMFEYRVKPEPREWWAEIYSTNKKYGVLYPTKEEAHDRGYPYEIVHVREVIDDK